MSYKNTQQLKAIKLLKKYFNDPGMGEFYIKENYHTTTIFNRHILKEAEKNIYHKFKIEALKYFSDNNISWWNSGETPSGHLLSSQISCINHLFGFRKDKKVATAFLMNYDKKIIEALIIDDGYIEFEKVGIEKLGNETSLKRGEFCTSIDAIMLGKRDDGKIVVFLIEWKYTESYKPESYLIGEKGKTRWAQYYDLLTDSNCPIKPMDFSFLYYEPFYQLMRQTLFGWKVIQRKEYGATDYIHIDVIPKLNVTLRNKITSPELSKHGNTVEEVWKLLLKEPGKYIMTTPEEFIQPALAFPKTEEITDYLKMRYHN